MLWIQLYLHSYVFIQRLYILNIPCWIHFTKIPTIDHVLILQGGLSIIPYKKNDSGPRRPLLKYLPSTHLSLCRGFCRHRAGGGVFHLRGQWANGTFSIISLGNFEAVSPWRWLISVWENWWKFHRVNKNGEMSCWKQPTERDLRHPT